jgi:uncharacterized RDD family membrane protein YckC
MNPEEIYISRVLAKLPAGALRVQIAAELRSHIAERVERGQSVEGAIHQLGDPTALAESYLSAVPMVPAPHLRRAVAKFVDLIIPLLFLCGMAAWYAFRVGPALGTGPLAEPVAILMAAFVIGTVTLYSIFLMVSEYMWGQTPGKRLFGLRVVTESGTRIGFGQAFVRQLPTSFQFFWVDGLFVLFTDRRQRAFELLSKTRVVVAEETGRGERVLSTSPIPVAL